jgi:hypothetical protein
MAAGSMLQAFLGNKIMWSVLGRLVVAGHLSLICCSSLQGQPPETIRVATFNCSLNREMPGELLQDLKGGSNAQARKVAAILRLVRPQIVLLNEFDYEESGEAVRVFMNDYLAVEADWATTPPMTYSSWYSAAVNTGVPSGRDLDHNGQSGDPADAIGFGRFPGQYGMVVLSQFPIDSMKVRTFQNLLWKSLPNAALPEDPAQAGELWYSEEDLNVLRLSSKSHWDVPIDIGSQTIHLLASHPTPPAFDGPENRNGLRNHDEIRLWAEYISEGAAEGSIDWLKDDQGVTGRLNPAASFVILGDQNADPVDGASHHGAIHQLLGHPRVNSSFTPRSDGAVAAATSQKGINLKHLGDPAHDTADFSDRSVGNLRADYVLPSRDLTVHDSGVFWPVASPAADLIKCSDHRLVWLDIAFPKP